MRILLKLFSQQLSVKPHSRLTDVLSKLAAEPPVASPSSGGIKNTGTAANPPMYFGGMSFQNTLTNALATVGLKKPSEYFTEATHTPIYDYNAPGSPEAATYKSGKIPLNTASGAMKNPDDRSMILRHEETRMRCWNRSSTSWTSDTALDKYVPKIRKGNSRRSRQSIKSVAGLPAENVISEGLAYKTGDGRVPGLGEDGIAAPSMLRGRLRIWTRALPGWYDKLSLGQLKEPAAAKIPDRELLNNPLYFAEPQKGIAEEAKKLTADTGTSKAIEAEAQALALNVAATKDLTSAIVAQTKAYEYGVSGGTAGEMPGGAAPPVVTGPTGTPVASPAATTSAVAGVQGAITGTIGAAGKAIDVPRLRILKSLTGGSASGGLGTIGAVIAGAGALFGGVTAIAKATGLGVGRGLHGGSSGGGGSDGNGAGVIVQQSAATNGYSNVFNPDTGRFDVQTPTGTVTPS